jgi:hypothetical protein
MDGGQATVAPDDGTTEAAGSDERDGGGSWLAELSVVTLIVSVAVFVAIGAFALMLIVEMFR